LFGGSSISIQAPLSGQTGCGHFRQIDSDAKEILITKQHDIHTSKKCSSGCFDSLRDEDTPALMSKKSAFPDSPIFQTPMKKLGEENPG
jgi:hypothetical protein